MFPLNSDLHYDDVMSCVNVDGFSGRASIQPEFAILPLLRLYVINHQHPRCHQVHDLMGFATFQFEPEHALKMSDIYTKTKPVHEARLILRRW